MDGKVVSKVLVGLGITAFLVGVIYYFKKGLFDLTEIDFSISNVKLPLISLNKIKITADVLLKNISDLGFNVTGYDISVSLNDRFVARLVNADNFSAFIPPKGEVIVPLAVEFDPKLLGLQLGLLVVDFLAQGKQSSEVKNIAIGYKGKLTGKFGALSLKDIPVDYTYVLS